MRRTAMIVAAICAVLMVSRPGLAAECGGLNARVAKVSALQATCVSTISSTSAQLICAQCGIFVDAMQALLADARACGNKNRKLTSMQRRMNNLERDLSEGCTMAR